MPLGQKVAVIGGGHNALIAAFYLAKGGFKPVVLERRDRVGGGAVTEEFYPGFRVSSLAHTLGPLRADVARDLQVEKFDCEILRPDPRVFAPVPDGRALLFYDDVAKTARAIARISAKDGERYPKFAHALEEIAGVFAQLSSITPPAIDKPTPEDLWNLFKTGRGVRALGKKRIFDLLRWGPMAVADFAAEFFETELIRAVIAARGIFGTALGPWSAGSTTVLLLRAATDANPVGSAAFARGGLGKFTNALAEAAKMAGAEIRTSAEVQHILLKDGAVTGVVLADGEEIAEPLFGVNRSVLFQFSWIRRNSPTVCRTHEEFPCERHGRKGESRAWRSTSFPALAGAVRPMGSEQRFQTNSYRARNRLYREGVRRFEVWRVFKSALSRNDDSDDS